MLDWNQKPWQPREEEMEFIIGRIKQILPNLAYSVCRRIKDFNFASTDNIKEDL